MSNQKLKNTIRALEELLLHQDFSSSPSTLDAMLAQEFHEINPDGQTVSREDVFDWLLKKDAAHRWQYHDFKTRILAPGLVLATYQAKQIFPEKPESKAARHTSLWKEVAADNTWQLLFHQSTRIS